MDVCLVSKKDIAQELRNAQLMGIRVELEKFIFQRLREHYGLPVHWSDNSTRVHSRRPRSRSSKQNASPKCNSVKSPIVIDNAHGGKVDNNS